MARITENVVIQRVGDLIVVMDDRTGEEITFPVELTSMVIGVLEYLTTPQTRTVRDAVTGQWVQEAPDWTL